MPRSRIKDLDLIAISKRSGISYPALYARYSRAKARGVAISEERLTRKVMKPVVWGGRNSKQWAEYFKFWGGVDLKPVSIRKHYNIHKKLGRSDKMIIEIQKTLWAPHRTKKEMTNK